MLNVTRISLQWNHRWPSLCQDARSNNYFQTLWNLLFSSEVRQKVRDAKLSDLFERIQQSTTDEILKKNVEGCLYMLNEAKPSGYEHFEIKSTFLLAALVLKVNFWRFFI